MFQSSFATVSEQVLSLNKNIVELLSKLDSLSTTAEPSVDVRLFDAKGVLTTYTLPSLGYIKAELDRLSRTVNEQMSLGQGDVTITDSEGRVRKVTTVSLEKSPPVIPSLSPATQFSFKEKWAVGGLMEPGLMVELDMRNAIGDDIRRCLVRRYIIKFNKLSTGELTSLGISARGQFQREFNGRNDITVTELTKWIRETPGVDNTQGDHYYENIEEIEPDVLLYDGIFGVLEIDEDKRQRKLWYVLNTLDYRTTSDGSVRKLTTGDELIVNTDTTDTKYRVIEVSETGSSPRVRLEKIIGFTPVTVGVGTLKIYSPVLRSKNLSVPVGYDEYSVLFVRPLHPDTDILARAWSKGMSFYTNELLSVNNGQSLEGFYVNNVRDYGAVLKDLVSKKIPNSMAVTPASPELEPGNFRVVQINKHLTDGKDKNTLKKKNGQVASLKEELEQIQESIEERNNRLRVTKFTSVTAKKKFEQEITLLENKRESKGRLLSTLNREIIDLSRETNSGTKPKYRVRGFWTIPNPSTVRGSRPQEVIAFRVEYRYVSKDGSEPLTETFRLEDAGERTAAAFSAWNVYETPVRSRTYNKALDVYEWVPEDIENVDSPNVNSVDIPITKGERVEIRIKSISEAGWPESPVESEWSDILTVEFPEELDGETADDVRITQDAIKEDIRSSLSSEFASKGLDKHLSETIVMENRTYYHSAESILSGFRDGDGNVMDLFRYLTLMEDRIKVLEERILRAKGELEIVVLRNSQEFSVVNNSTIEFNIECEDYMTEFTATGVPTGRVYANNVYVIKDFSIMVKNKSADSPLGLLSEGLYSGQSDYYNPAVPQVFWVTPQDSLLYDDTTGVSRTHLNNHFIWSVNYESVQDGQVNRLASNMGNSFQQDQSNSLTDIFSQPEYNLGYSEPQMINFLATNNSLIEPNKWVDDVVTVASTVKFLTTVHPVVPSLTEIVEKNREKVRIIDPKGEVLIPVNLYFKANSLDNSQSGVNYRYVIFDNTTETVKHSKKLRLLMKDEARGRNFSFTLVFNMNRNKTIFTSPAKNYTSVVK
jgi:TolA-binding protein